MLRTDLDFAAMEEATWRVSSGSAAVLRLAEERMETAPTTAYIMLGERCQRNCAYCAQAHGSRASSAALSRVIWPPFQAGQVARAVARAYVAQDIKRACLQVTSGQDSFQRTLAAVSLLHSYSLIPICCSLAVDTIEQVEELLAAGADKVTLALDTACERVYRQVRGNDWSKRSAQLLQAGRRFPGRISTHLIVGLGELECELVSCMQELHDCGIGLGLFAFTPIAGTKMAHLQPPALASYRRMQAARYLIYECGISSASFQFDASGKLSSLGISKMNLGALIGEGTAFRTSGCPDCNRPYYNERPGGTIYNYPRTLTKQELEAELQILLASLEQQ